MLKKANVLRKSKQTAAEDYHITPRGVNPQMQLTHWINDLHPLNMCPTSEQQGQYNFTFQVFSCIPPIPKNYGGIFDESKNHKLWTI